MKSIQFIYLFLISPIIFSGCDLLIKKEPLVTITQPVDGSIVKGPVVVKVNVEHDSKIEKVSLLVDGNNIGIDNQKPFEFIWQTAFWSTAVVHELKAKAIDSKGISGTSRAVEVKINNQGLNLPVGTQPLFDSVIVDEDSVHFNWTPTIGTDKYQVDISHDSGFESLLFNGETADTFLTFNLKEEGSYYWRVRACDRDSRCSSWTEPLRFWIRENVFYKILFDSVGYFWPGRTLKVIESSYGEYEIIERIDSELIIYNVNSNGEIYNMKKYQFNSYPMGIIEFDYTESGYYITNGFRTDSTTVFKIDKIGVNNWHSRFSVKGNAEILRTINGSGENTAIVVGNTVLKNRNFSIFLVKVKSNLFENPVKYVYGDSVGFNVKNIFVIDTNKFLLYGYLQREFYKPSLICINLDGTIEWEFKSFEGITSWSSYLSKSGNQSILFWGGDDPINVIIVDLNGQIINKFSFNKRLVNYINKVILVEDGLIFFGRSSHYGNGNTVLLKVDYLGNVIWSKEYDDPYDLRSGNLGLYYYENGIISFSFGGNREKRKITVSRANSDGYFNIQPRRSYP